MSVGREGGEEVAVDVSVHAIPCTFRRAGREVQGRRAETEPWAEQDGPRRRCLGALQRAIESRVNA